jgi:hypothetical protein
VGDSEERNEPPGAYKATDRAARARRRVRRPARPAASSQSGWSDVEPPPSLETLEEQLKGEPIDQIFEPSVSLIEDGKTIQVTVKNVSRAAHTCHIALGFDTPVPFDLKEVGPVPKSNSRSVNFIPPKHWLLQKGPRWLLVLITLEKVTEEDLRLEFGQEYFKRKKRDRLIRFSMHPLVVSEPIPTDEE